MGATESDSLNKVEDLEDRVERPSVERALSS